MGHVYRLKDGGIFSSYWGLKGSEEVGGGYKINFKLQGTFNTMNGKFGLADTQGTTAIFNQFATIGASGPFGTFDAGRRITPMIYAMAETEVRGAQYFGSILTAWLGMNQAAGWPGTSTTPPIGAPYDSNALVYNSPKFYGTSLALEYALGGVAGQFQGGTRESAVLKFSNYGLNLSAVYYNGHDTNPFPLTYPAAPAVSATGLANNRFIYFGALYTIDRFSISGSYSIGKNPAKSNSLNQTIIHGALVAPGVSTTAAMIGIRHTF